MTIDNMRRADELISATSDENMKRELKDKNRRRGQALEGMRHEINDKIDADENNYR